MTMNATTPAAEAAMIGVREKVCESRSDPDEEGAEVDVNAGFAVVFVDFRLVAPCFGSVLVATKERVGAAPMCVDSVGAAIGSPDVLVVARSLMTVAEPRVKTLESSLQHVLPSE